MPTETEQADLASLEAARRQRLLEMEQRTQQRPFAEPGEGGRLDAHHRQSLDDLLGKAAPAGALSVYKPAALAAVRPDAAGIAQIDPATGLAQVDPATGATALTFRHTGAAVSAHRTVAELAATDPRLALDPALDPRLAGQVGVAQKPLAGRTSLQAATDPNLQAVGLAATDPKLQAAGLTDPAIAATAAITDPAQALAAGQTQTAVTAANPALATAGAVIEKPELDKRPAHLRPVGAPQPHVDESEIPEFYGVDRGAQTEKVNGRDIRTSGDPEANGRVVGKASNAGPGAPPAAGEAGPAGPAAGAAAPTSTAAVTVGKSTTAKLDPHEDWQHKRAEVESALRKGHTADATPAQVHEVRAMKGRPTYQGHDL